MAVPDARAIQCRSRSSLIERSKGKTFSSLQLVLIDTFLCLSSRIRYGNALRARNGAFGGTHDSAPGRGLIKLEDAIILTAVRHEVFGTGTRDGTMSNPGLGQQPGGPG